MLLRLMSTWRGFCTSTIHLWSIAKEQKSQKHSLFVRCVCVCVCSTVLLECCCTSDMFFPFFCCIQTLLELVQAPGLSYSCHRLLLQVVSALLMGENLSLPASSIHELVKKVCLMCTNTNVFPIWFPVDFISSLVPICRSSIAAWTETSYCHLPKRCLTWNSLSRSV